MGVPNRITPTARARDSRTSKAREAIAASLTAPSVPCSVLLEARAADEASPLPAPDDIRPWTNESLERAASVMRKYAGYIARQKLHVLKLRKMDGKKIPPDFDYDRITSLLAESRQKLKQIRPSTVGQASRIPGVTPADVAVLLVHLGKRPPGPAEAGENERTA